MVLYIVGFGHKKLDFNANCALKALKFENRKPYRTSKK